jgi:polyisoprenoid-binding protein YceI
MRTPILFALLLSVTPAFAQPAAAPAQAAPAAGSLLSAKESKLTYHLVHKLHKFDGVSSKAEAKARIHPDGKVQVMVKVPVESFDSGNANRDSHMKETIEAARFPTVELKAMGEAPTPATFPTTVERTFKGELAFHGVKKMLDIPVKLTYTSGTSIKAEATLKLSLEDFKIERPSLMFVKIDNEMPIEVSITFGP